MEANQSMSDEAQTQIKNGDTVRFVQDLAGGYGVGVEGVVISVGTDYHDRPTVEIEHDDGVRTELVSNVSLIESVESDDESDDDTESDRTDVCGLCGGVLRHVSTTDVNHWINEASTYQSHTFRCDDCGEEADHTSRGGWTGYASPVRDEPEIMADGGVDVDDLVEVVEPFAVFVEIDGGNVTAGFASGEQFQSAVEALPSGIRMIGRASPFDGESHRLTI